MISAAGFIKYLGNVVNRLIQLSLFLTLCGSISLASDDDGLVNHIIHDTHGSGMIPQLAIPHVKSLLQRGNDYAPACRLYHFLNGFYNSCPNNPGSLTGCYEEFMSFKELVRQRQQAATSNNTLKEKIIEINNFYDRQLQPEAIAAYVHQCQPQTLELATKLRANYQQRLQDRRQTDLVEVMLQFDRSVFEATKKEGDNTSPVYVYQDLLGRQLKVAARHLNMKPVIYRLNYLSQVAALANQQQANPQQQPLSAETLAAYGRHCQPQTFEGSALVDPAFADWIAQQSKSTIAAYQTVRARLGQARIQEEFESVAKDKVDHIIKVEVLASASQPAKLHLHSYEVDKNDPHCSHHLRQDVYVSRDNSLPLVAGLMTYTYNEQTDNIDYNPMNEGQASDGIVWPVANGLLLYIDWDGNVVATAAADYHQFARIKTSGTLRVQNLDPDQLYLQGKEIFINNQKTSGSIFNHDLPATAWQHLSQPAITLNQDVVDFAVYLKQNPLQPGATVAINAKKFFLSEPVDFKGHLQLNCEDLLSPHALTVLSLKAKCSGTFAPYLDGSGIGSIMTTYGMAVITKNCDVSKGRVHSGGPLRLIVKGGAAVIGAKDVDEFKQARSNGAALSSNDTLTLTLNDQATLAIPYGTLFSRGFMKIASQHPIVLTSGKIWSLSGGKITGNNIVMTEAVDDSLAFVEQESQIYDFTNQPRNAQFRESQKLKDYLQQTVVNLNRQLVCDRNRQYFEAKDGGIVRLQYFGMDSTLTDQRPIDQTFKYHYCSGHYKVTKYSKQAKRHNAGLEFSNLTGPGVVTMAMDNVEASNVSLRTAGNLDGLGQGHWLINQGASAQTGQDLSLAVPAVTLKGALLGQGITCRTKVSWIEGDDEDKPHQESTYFSAAAFRDHVAELSHFNPFIKKGDLGSPYHYHLDIPLETLIAVYPCLADLVCLETSLPDGKGRFALAAEVLDVALRDLLFPYAGSSCLRGRSLLAQLHHNARQLGEKTITVEALTKLDQAMLVYEVVSLNAGSATDCTYELWPVVYWPKSAQVAPHRSAGVMAADDFIDFHGTQWARFISSQVVADDVDVLATNLHCKTKKHRQHFSVNDRAYDQKYDDYEQQRAQFIGRKNLLVLGESEFMSLSVDNNVGPEGCILGCLQGDSLFSGNTLEHCDKYEIKRKVKRALGHDCKYVRHDNSTVKTAESHTKASGPCVFLAGPEHTITTIGQNFYGPEDSLIYEGKILRSSPAVDKDFSCHYLKKSGICGTRTGSYHEQTDHTIHPSKTIVRELKYNLKDYAHVESPLMQAESVVQNCPTLAFKAHKETNTFKSSYHKNDLIKRSKSCVWGEQEVALPPMVKIGKFSAPSESGVTEFESVIGEIDELYVNHTYIESVATLNSRCTSKSKSYGYGIPGLTSKIRDPLIESIKSAKHSEGGSDDIAAAIQITAQVLRVCQEVASLYVDGASGLIGVLSRYTVLTQGFSKSRHEQKRTCELPGALTGKIFHIRNSSKTQLAFDKDFDDIVIITPELTAMSPTSESQSHGRNYGLSISFNPVTTLMTGIPDIGISGNFGSDTSYEKHHRPVSVKGKRVFFRIGNALIQGTTIDGELVDAIIAGDLKVESLQDEVKRRHQAYEASTGVSPKEIKLPDGRAAYDSVLEKLINAKAGLHGQQQCYITIDGQLQTVSAEVGLKADGHVFDGVPSQDGQTFYRRFVPLTGNDQVFYALFANTATLDPKGYIDDLLAHNGDKPQVKAEQAGCDFFASGKAYSEALFGDTPQYQLLNVLAALQQHNLVVYTLRDDVLTPVHIYHGDQEHWPTLHLEVDREAQQLHVLEQSRERLVAQEIQHQELNSIKKRTKIVANVPYGSAMNLVKEAQKMPDLWDRVQEKYAYNQMSEEEQRAYDAKKAEEEARNAMPEAERSKEPDQDIDGDRLAYDLASQSEDLQDLTNLVEAMPISESEKEHLFAATSQILGELYKAQAVDDRKTQAEILKVTIGEDGKAYVDTTPSDLTAWDFTLYTLAEKTGLGENLQFGIGEEERRGRTSERSAHPSTQRDHSPSKGHNLFIDEMQEIIRKEQAYRADPSTSIFGKVCSHFYEYTTRQGIKEIQNDLMRHSLVKVGQTIAEDLVTKDMGNPQDRQEMLHNITVMAPTIALTIVKARLNKVGGASKAAGFNSKIFTQKSIWTAPSGTKQTYKVYQRNDINWDMVRTAGPGKFRNITNAQAAALGKAPQLADGSFATLHHLNQNGKGNLVEASTRYHGIGKPGQNTLHGIYGRNKPHPTSPVDRPKFDSDTANYWKWRVNNQ